ncbi:MAG: MBL fold metallo-hydrolase [SAR324 cluster bacterium]|nr:MBL fold metallo-hydrolase [SAR324 cluster bacterium]
MKIEFVGGARTVTGSKHLLTVNGKRILLECGLFQGKRMESYEKNISFPFDPATIDAVIISHAHMDHSGNLPNLVKLGFKGKIYMTKASTELCSILLEDCAFLQEHDLTWLNKRREKQHKPLLEPFYNQEDVKRTIRHFFPMEYGETLEIFSGIKLTLRDAGHILGSAGVLLEINEQGRQFRFGFSGDIGRDNMAVICDPNPLRDLDVLIMECTYGNRLHEDSEKIEEALVAVVQKIMREGGKLIIPAFAVGRTQQLVYHLHKLFDQNRIPDIPIFVDSPLASRATEVFRRHPEILDRAANRNFLIDGQDPFGFYRLTYTKQVEESKAIQSLVYPHIIISASGMAEGGRILHHLRNNIENPKTVILFVGFAAESTLARKIMDGEKQIKIFGNSYQVRAQIMMMESFSAHADRADLLKYIRFSAPEKLKKLFLVHGEPGQAESLIDAISSQGYQEVYFPKPGDIHQV